MIDEKPDILNKVFLPHSSFSNVAYISAPVDLSIPRPFQIPEIENTFCFGLPYLAQINIGKFLADLTANLPAEELYWRAHKVDSLTTSTNT